MSLTVVVSTIIAVALVVFLSLALSDRHTDGPSRIPRALRIAAGMVTVAVASMLVWPAWQDSGAFALVLVGVPVVCAIVMIAATVADRWAALATWTAAVALLIWSLLTSLGLGLYFLGPAVLMIVAAAAAGRGRQTT